LLYFHFADNKFLQYYKVSKILNYTLIKMKPFFCRLYNYNIWRHNTLYSKIKEVDKYKKNLEKKFPQQLYFTSIKATFNHLLLGDLLWLNRITKNNEIELHVINQKIKINELS